MTRSTHTRTAVVTLAVLALAGCGGGSDAADSPSSSHPASTSTSTSASASPLQLQDGWVKASSTHMTGLFGTLRNTSDRPLRVLRVTTALSPRVELHETVKDPGTGGMVMREAAQGFTIPAHATFVLEPGANHIMLMGLTRPLQPGDSTEITLVDDSGASTRVTVQVREFAGAQETYVPSGEHSASSTSR